MAARSSGRPQRAAGGRVTEPKRRPSAAAARAAAATPAASSAPASRRGGRGGRATGGVPMREVLDGVPTYRRLGKRWRLIVPVMAGVTTALALLQVATGVQGWPTTALVALLYLLWALRLTRPLVRALPDRIEVRNIRSSHVVDRDDLEAVGLRKGSIGLRSPVLIRRDGTQVGALGLPPGLALTRPDVAQVVAGDLGAPVLDRNGDAVATP